MLRVRYEYMGLDGCYGRWGWDTVCQQQLEPYAQCENTAPRILAASPPHRPCSPRLPRTNGLLVHAGVDLIYIALPERIDVVKAGRGFQLPPRPS